MLVKQKGGKREALCLTSHLSFYKAGAAGLEPTNVGSRVRCLTTWRRPNAGKDFTIPSAQINGFAEDHLLKDFAIQFRILNLLASILATHQHVVQPGEDHSAIHLENLNKSADGVASDLCK